MLLWNDFIEKLADAHNLVNKDKNAFLVRFAQQNLHPHQPDVEVAKSLYIGESTLQKYLGKVYVIFASSCPSLKETTTKGKFEILRCWLETMYVQYQKTGELPGLPKTSNLGVGKSAIADRTQGQGEPDDFYVEPPATNFCCNEILKPECLLRIKAPRKMGKTELMSRIVRYADNQGYRTAHLSLRDTIPSEDFNDPNQFLKWFCTIVTSEVTEEPLLRVDKYWDNSIGNSKIKCKSYFETYLLHGESPLVLALDDVDQVFPYSEIAREFLSMLRTWHEKAKTRPIWRKLRQVLAYTEDYRESDINLSPFNVGTPIELPELHHEQVQKLVRQYELNWDTDQVNQLMKLIGGHPYLVKEATKNVAQQRVSLDELLEKAATNAGIYSEYLQCYWGRLQKSPELATAFSEVVMADVPVELNSDLAKKLHNLGLVKLESNGAIPCNKLYRQYFRSLLGSTR